jgi:fructoselysine 6-kinase
MVVRFAGPRLLGLGDNTMDTYVDAGLQFPGGNVVNVAARGAAAGYGKRVSRLVGTDAAAHGSGRRWRREGVDLAQCRFVQGANARRVSCARGRPIFSA